MILLLNAMLTEEHLPPSQFGQLTTTWLASSISRSKSGPPSVSSRTENSRVVFSLQDRHWKDTFVVSIGFCVIFFSFSPSGELFQGTIVLKIADLIKFVKLLATLLLGAFLLFKISYNKNN
ncbi:MAG: hypothetical protein HQ536_01460 [Parcubacteria group bacterium]|nr:hypothetical protein [Parcubacteria group bacterium]